MTSPNITTVNKDNFEEEVLKSDKLVLIDFYADWCAPCKALAPKIDEIADAHTADIKVVKINVDESPELAAAFGIRALPTLVTMKDGQGLYGAVGNLKKSDLDKFVAMSLNPPANDGPAAPKGPTP